MSGAGASRWFVRARWWLVVAVAVVIAVGAALTSWQAAVPAGPVTGPVRQRGDAPGWELPDLRDKTRTVSLADFSGRPLVINFFAAWCAPCRREMPAFEAVYRRARPRVAFVGIDNRDIRGDGLALVRAAKVSYPVAFDPAGRVAAEYGVVGMPTTVFVSPDGAVLERVTGEMSQARLLEALQRLFPRPADN